MHSKKETAIFLQYNYLYKQIDRWRTLFIKKILVLGSIFSFKNPSVYKAPKKKKKKKKVLLNIYGVILMLYELYKF